MRPDEYIRMYEAEDTHWWYVALHELIMQSLPGGRYPLEIFDAGCGTGRLLELLGSRGTARGCDSSPAALTLCRKREVEAVLGDLNRMEPGTEMYDIITCIDVLYHRDIKDEGAVLRTLYRALKPGGTLILQVPAYEWLRSSHDEAVQTGRRYTRKKLASLVQACGFIVHKSTYRVTFLFVLIAALRLVRKLTRAGVSAHRSSDVKKHSVAVNGILTLLQKCENILLKRLSLPFGTSVFIVAQKRNPYRFPPGKCQD
jgi:SAM-dependent methyltransferase